LLVGVDGAVEGAVLDERSLSDSERLDEGLPTEVVVAVDSSESMICLGSSLSVWWLLHVQISCCGMLGTGGMSNLSLDGGLDE
jgi:hypothetical protein